MNVEQAIRDGIYNEISELLGKADSMEKASAYLANYFQCKMHEGVIDMFDYSLDDMGPNGIHASVKYSYQWNVDNTCIMVVSPKRSLAKAFDHAMSVV